MQNIFNKTRKFIKDNYIFIIIIISIILLFTIELPYVVYSPGGTINLENRVTIENETKSEGSYNMAYVRMFKGNIPFVLLSYILPNYDLVKTSDITLENESVDEMIKTDHYYLEEAIDNATISAYTLLNKKVYIKGINNIVSLISGDAKTDLKLYDQIISINNKDITTLDDMKEYVNTLKDGETVSIKIKRDNKELSVNSTIYNTTDGLKIGIGIITLYDFEADPKITIKSKSSESGPSGGLMMALDIYDKLANEDLTKGRKIIGTGTIDRLGNVGAIGGIKYKLLGAERKKGDVFIVPNDNYNEALKIKEENKLKIKLISVNTLQEAITKLSED